MLVLVALGTAGSLLRERELVSHVGVSVTAVILTATLAIVGPVGAAVVGYISVLLGSTHSRWRTRLFNAAMSGTLGAGAGLVYLSAGGEVHDPFGEPQTLLLGLVVPLFLAYLAFTLGNVVLIGVMSRLVSGAPALRTAVRLLRSAGWNYLLHALLAVLFVILWEPAGLTSFAALLIVGPLLVAQWTLSRDADERRAHVRTVSTLVAALEAANPYSVGHGARVAELSDRVAPRLGVMGNDAEALHLGALLHDIGLMATSAHVRPSEGTDYLASVSEHPGTGVRMLVGIDFLAPALPGVLHHHERVDGRGYPSGLEGEAIPLFARIIAMADAFDSLTTTRSYRPAMDQDDALAELRRRVGTHLDGTVVEALGAELAARPWQPTLLDKDVMEAVGDSADHDDPSVSDRYAAWDPEGADTG